MKKFLYVTSKALEGIPRLIGILSENNGRYTFEYKLGGKLQEWFLRIDEFPDLTRTYDGEEVEKFIYRLIPPKDNIYIPEFLKTYNLPCYDVWEFLKAMGSHNPSRQDAFLYEKLPKNCILYEDIETATA